MFNFRSILWVTDEVVLAETRQPVHHFEIKSYVIIIVCTDCFQGQYY